MVTLHLAHFGGLDKPEESDCLNTLDGLDCSMGLVSKNKSNQNIVRQTKTTEE